MACATLRHANQKRQQEWLGNNQTSLTFKGNELGGETGEVQNILKKIERERMGVAGSRATVEDLADEIGDVIICLDLIAAEFGIDLEEAARCKFNKTSIKYGLSTRYDRPDE